MTTIRHVVELKAAPQDIRLALTTHEGISGWWAKDARVGSGPNADHELRFNKGGQDVVMKFRVDIDTDKKVAWTCTDNGNPVWKGTTLTWTLEPRGETTRVVFEHAGFSEDASPPYQMTVQGWEHFVESLRAYAEGGSGQPW